MINNRQAGRRRGRGGNNGGNNGPRQGGGGGQRDTGNRIDSRARGNANQLYEKYKNLAADSQRQGDRVNTEYYLQFADHYFRVLSETRSRFEEQNQQNQQNPQRRPREDFDAQPFTGSFDTGFDGQDDDYADEGEPIRAGDQAFAEDRGGGDRDGNRDGNRSDERPPRAANGQAPRRDDRPRDASPREDRPRRDDRQGADRQGADRQGADRQGGDRPQREQFAREQGVQDQAPREGESSGRRPRRYREDGAPVNGDVAEPALTVAPVAPAASVPTELPVATPSVATEPSGEAEAPRRRGRPRRERPVEDDAPAAFDAALLPPSIGALPSPPAADAADGEEKPRRRRVRATPPVEVTSAS